MDSILHTGNPTASEEDRLRLLAERDETATRLLAEEKAARLLALQEELRTLNEAADRARLAMDQEHTARLERAALIDKDDDVIAMTGVLGILPRVPVGLGSTYVCSVCRTP